MEIFSSAIEIEGHDKNGKDTIHKYIEQLGGYKYTLNVRGLLTQLVYNDKFNRDNEYLMTYKPLIILLSADEPDVEIRCRMTHEPKINSKKDTEVYEYYAKTLEDLGAAVVWRYNTSELTPYKIGQDIVKRLEGLRPEDFMVVKDEFLVVPSYNRYKKEDLDNEEVYYSGLESLESNEPDLKGPKYLECNDLFGNKWYKNLWTNEDLPIGTVPLDLHNYNKEV